MTDLESPVSPLSVWEIVNQSFELYYRNLGRYFLLALQYFLWTFLFTILWIIWSICISIFFNIQGKTQPGFFILITLASFILLFWQSVICLAKAFLNMVLISRLAYGELTHQQETVTTARQVLKPRLFRIFFTFFYTTLVFLFFNIILSILTPFISHLCEPIIVEILPESFSNIFTLLLSSREGFSQPETANLIAIVFANVIAFTVYSWIISHWFIVDLPIAVESPINASQSIVRSLKLSQGSALRILIIISIAFLATVLLYLIPFVPPILALIQIIPILLQGVDVFTQALLTQVAPTIPLSFLLFSVINMVLMGFWQSLKAVTYYDLRLRCGEGNMVWNTSD